MGGCDRLFSKACICKVTLFQVTFRCCLEGFFSFCANVKDGRDFDESISDEKAARGSYRLFA